MWRIKVFVFFMLINVTAFGQGLPFPGPGGVPASSCNSAWVPTASGVKADLAIDFTTEGTTNHYWYNTTCYGSFSALLTALGGTYSRAATTNGAWYTNSSGLLASAGTNVLRYNYNPVGTVNVGILLEGVATNLVLWARDLTQSGTWVATTMTTALTSTGADGTANSATRLTATAPLATILQTPGLSSANRTLSMYIRRVTGSGTIKLTVDGTALGSDVSGSLNSSTYTRIALTANAVPISGVQIGTSGDAIDVDFVQLEAGTATIAPTSPILTTSATVTRATDVLNWPVPFTAWSTTTGSLIVVAAKPVASAVLTAMSFSDGTVSNRITQAVTTTSGVNALVVTDGGVSQAAITAAGANTAAYAINKIGGAWAANDFVAVVNAGTPGTDASGTVPSSINIAQPGTTGTATVNFVNIQGLYYWGSRISNGDLVTLTTP